MTCYIAEAQGIYLNLQYLRC